MFPQDESEAQPKQFEDLAFDYYFLQPLDDENIQENTRSATEYCLQNPQWQLSLQTHKLLGID